MPMDQCIPPVLENYMYLRRIFGISSGSPVYQDI